MLNLGVATEGHPYKKIPSRFVGVALRGHPSGHNWHGLNSTVAMPCAMSTSNDIPLLSIPRTAINRIREDRSGVSAGQVVPSALQTTNAISAVAIVSAIATRLTAYNATLRCAEQARRTSTKLICCSIATRIGPVTSNSHNAFGVVALTSSSIASPQSWREVNDRVKQQPDRDHPVPVNSDRHNIDAVLHVELAVKNPDRQQHDFSRQDHQVKHVHAEHEPDDRTVSITVPTKVDRRVLKTAQHERAESADCTDLQP